jgi:hypothetical protein
MTREPVDWFWSDLLFEGHFLLIICTSLLRENAKNWHTRIGKSGDNYRAHAVVLLGTVYLSWLVNCCISSSINDNAGCVCVPREMCHTIRKTLHVYCYKLFEWSDAGQWTLQAGIFYGFSAFSLCPNTHLWLLSVWTYEGRYRAGRSVVCERPELSTEFVRNLALWFLEHTTVS